MTSEPGGKWYERKMEEKMSVHTSLGPVARANFWGQGRCQKAQLWLCRCLIKHTEDCFSKMILLHVVVSFLSKHVPYMIQFSLLWGSPRILQTEKWQTENSDNHWKPIPAEYRQILVHDNSRYNLVHTWTLNQYGIGTESKRDWLGWNHATIGIHIEKCVPKIEIAG